MKGTILLNHYENTKQVEEEEKRRFLRSLLDQMGIPPDQLEFWSSDEPLTIEQRMQLRKILSSYNIQVIDDPDDMSIYVDNQKVASWSKPHYKLKGDPSQLDPKKRLYLEMGIECWSLFEETESEK